MSISDDNARRVFVLEVAGLPVRYKSGSFDPTTSNLSSTIVSGISYTDIESIVSVGSYSSTLDPSGGVASYGAVVVTLSSDRLRGGEYDPSVIFGRCGARASAPFRSQVLTEILYDTDAGTVDIDTPTSGVSYPALFHIGAETIKVTGASSLPIGERLTFSDRAVGYSQRQSHLITQGGTSVPEMSTAITTFRGRRASLWVAQQYPDGGLSDFSQIINGFIDSSPIVEEGGTVSISLTPIIALLDGPVSGRGRNSTFLKQGFHYYSGREGSYLEWAVSLEDGGSVYYVDRASINSSTGQLELWDNGPDDLALFWIQGPNGVDPPTDGAHPRYPRLQGNYTNGTEQIFYLTAGGPRFFSYDTTNTVYDIAGTSPYIIVKTYSSPEIKRFKLGTSEVKLWPDVAIEGLLNESPYPVTYSGSWARWQLSTENTITVSPTADPHGVRPRVYLSHGSLQFLGEDEEGRPRARYWNANGPQPPLLLRSKLWYPLDIRSPQSEAQFSQEYRYNEPREWNARVFKCADNASQRTVTYPIRDVASAYYQWRELTILVEDGLGLPASASAGTSYDIQIKYFDKRLEDTAYQWVKATHQTAATYDGVTVGYLIHLDPAQDWNLVSSFGDWSDADRAEIYGGAIFDRERPGEIILKLLQSGGGNGKLGAYDVYSIGLAIPASDIDEDSFFAYDGTSSFTYSGAISGDGVRVKDVIDSMLKAMSCALIMKRNRYGRTKITLQPIGSDVAAHTSASIQEGDWLADQPPTWSIYEDVVTQTVVKYQWSTEEQKFESEIIFNNQEAINRYGGEHSRTTLELYGLTNRDIGSSIGSASGYFLPVVARQWNLLSNPMRLWRGSIGTGQSLLLDVGSYVEVSSPLLKGYGDEWGVTNGVGMVQSISQELMGEGAQLDIITTGTNPTVWNASAEVTTINSSTAVTVANSTYGSIAKDVTFFEIDDVVDYLPKGDHDNAITGLTISNIVGNIITFSSAHGITIVGGSLEPTIYTSATAHEKTSAYLASDTSPPVLGSSTEAQKYS